ncbi:SET domain-containing protein [Hypomontagnella monticulosa]|nr:SET domain-containing protein [Hypomontagnella monticulosa]
MEPHEELLDWATSQGVKLNGIAPKRIPGRGIGLVATRKIKSGETVLEIPTCCLRSIDTVRKPIIRHLPKSISIHGLLAADLALDASSKYSAWNAVYPTPEDFLSIPLLWPSELCALLPLEARDLLSKQEAKLKRDWAAVSSAFPEHQKRNLDEARYRYAWLLVNTRTFYYVNTKLKRRPEEDRMCLQPVADLFNHDSEGCHVAFDTAGFSIKTTQAYKVGDELKISYGKHSGDFLLAEYGFVMDDNHWDEVRLDDVLLPKLSSRQKEMLEEARFLGKYVVDKHTDCHRTQVAVRLLCCGFREWKRFVDGIDDGERSQRAADNLVLELLKEQRQLAEKRISEAEALAIGNQQQREILIKRWRQIQDLVDTRIEDLEESN